jgi:hypothetical protein
MTETSHEDRCGLVIISRSVLLIIRNVSDKCCRENQTTHFMFNKFFSTKCWGVWGNLEKYGTTRQATGYNTIRHMRCACWINKAIGTHSEYVILTAFPRQQWLRHRASLLLSTYIACWSYAHYVITLYNRTLQAVAPTPPWPPLPTIMFSEFSLNCHNKVNLTVLYILSSPDLRKPPAPGGGTRGIVYDTVYV